MKVAMARVIDDAVFDPVGCIALGVDKLANELELGFGDWGSIESAQDAGVVDHGSNEVKDWGTGENAVKVARKSLSRNESLPASGGAPDKVRFLRRVSIVGGGDGLCHISSNVYGAEGVVEKLLRISRERAERLVLRG